MLDVDYNRRGYASSFEKWLWKLLWKWLSVSCVDPKQRIALAIAIAIAMFIIPIAMAIEKNIAISNDLVFRDFHVDSRLICSLSLGAEIVRVRVRTANVHQVVDFVLVLCYWPLQGRADLSLCTKLSRHVRFFF